MEINNKDGEEQSYVRNVLELTTVGTKKITSLRNNDYSFVVKKEKTYNDHLIGLKQAVRLAEKTGRYKRFFCFDVNQTEGIIGINGCAE